MSKKMMGLGAMTDQALRLTRSSIKPLVPVLFVYMLISVVMGQWVMPQLKPGHIQPVLFSLYLFLLFFICSASLLVFSIQKSIHTGQRIRPYLLLQQYRSQVFGFVVFYVLSFLACLGAVCIGLSMRGVIGDGAALLVVVASVLFAVSRLIMAMPSLSEGEGVRAAIRQGWQLSQGRVMYVLMALVVMVLVLMAILGVFSIAQTVLLLAVYGVNDLAQAKSLPVIEYLAGLVLLVAIPFMHAYILSLWYELKRDKFAKALQTST